MMPTVMGVPVEFGAGLKVMQPNMTGTDAVPLIDGQTAGILQAINSAGPVRPASAAKEADWPRLTDARGSLVHDLALTERSLQRASCTHGAGRRLSRRLSRLAFDTGAVGRGDHAGLHRAEQRVRHLRRDQRQPRLRRRRAL
eukprot:scaffold7109_cov63-Phaeocystis_antarctica.AAC.13